MKRAKLIAILGLTLLAQEIAYSQATESKGCFEILKVPCDSLNNVIEALVKYPIVKREIVAFNEFYFSKKAQYTAEKDSLIRQNLSSQKTAKKQLKRAKIWGNVKPIAIIIGFIALF